MSRRLSTSFQAKLNRVIGLALVLSLLMMTVTVSFIERKYSRKSLVRELEVISDMFSNRSVAPLLFFDVEAADRNFVAAKFHDSIDSLCLYDAKNKLFSYFSRKDVDACEGLYQGLEGLFGDNANDGQRMKKKVEFLNRKIVLINPVRDNSNLLGYVLLTANEKELVQEQIRLTLILLVLFSFTLILTYLFTRRIIASLLLPLHLLSQTVSSISKKGTKGERAERLSDDEIGDLVDTFNHMLESIERENEALHQSESKFRILAENAPIGIYLKDTQNKPLYVNSKWRDITGFEPGYSHSKYLSAISDIDIARYEIFMESNLESTNTCMIEYNFRKMGMHRDSVLMEYITPIFLKSHDSQDGAISGYIGTLVDVTDLKDAQDELEKLAFFDPLTNLPNRRYFRDHLERELEAARKSGYTVAIMLVDLDNFKRVNDSLGHDAGDILLSVLADRLRQRLSKHDIVARMGGDEFYIVLKDMQNRSILDAVSTRIGDALSQPIRIKNHFVEITASIGIAIFPDHADSSEELIRNADIALYQAKEQGKDRVAYFSGEMQAVVQEKMHLESRLRQAVFNNELEIYIQPQFDARTNRFGWGEVLLRWQYLDLGFIPPDKFIPVAEETGIINYIDEWVLRASCQTLRDDGESLAEIGIYGLSVNMSAKQFYSKTMLETVQRTFDDFGVAPSKISFELTESMVIEDISMAISSMHKLQKLGCSISLDDFGTGYSSLSHLKRLPIDNLKIDRSFISDIPGDSNDVAITEAIIAMAEKLKISVIAEGIETKEQCDFLVEKKCFRMQGYYFAKPMSLATLLGETRPRKHSA